MARKITWTSNALRERREIFNYWNRRNKSARYSRCLRHLFRDTLEQLARQPFVGTLTDEHGIRRKLAADYFIFYIITDAELVVISIWDTRRNPEDNPYHY